MATPSMAAVIRRCLAGDPQAQEELVLAAQNRVYYHCKKMLKHEEDALDATQEVLISMLTKLDKLQDPEAFWGWLSAMAANHCRNVLTRGRREAQIPEDDEGNSLLDAFEDLDEQTVPDKALDNDETRRIIVDLVDQLPDTQRQCVLMYYYEEMGVKDIANALGVSEGTVKSRLNYARKAIKAGVDGYTAQGIKLYSALPFLMYFLQRDSVINGLSGSGAELLAQTVLAGTAGTAAAGSAAAGASAGSGSAGTAAGAVSSGGAASHAAQAGPLSHGLGELLGHKAVLGLVGLAAAGAVAGGVILSQPEAGPAEEPAPVVEAAEPAEEEADALAVAEGVAIDPMMAVTYPTTQMRLRVLDASTGREVPLDEVTWNVETPDLISIDASDGWLTGHGTPGTASFTASWNGYTARSTLELVPQEDQIWLWKVGTVVYPESREGTSLYEDTAQKFGSDYTVEWSVSDPTVLELEPVIYDDGARGVFFTSLKHGSAVITCTVTWPDGTQRHCYCNVYVFFSRDIDYSVSADPDL